jgi:hypothetical protein
MRTVLVRRLVLGFAWIGLASAPVLAAPPDPPDPPTPKPPVTVTNPMPGGGSVSITRTDEDRDGTYDKSVYVEKDGAGRVVRRVTETDTNNDGKAEKSTFEQYKDPTKAAPSTKETRVRDPADTGWRTVTTEADADQDGTAETKKKAESGGGNSRFEVVTTFTDSDDDGTTEKEERKLANPGGADYDTTLTTTRDPRTGEERGPVRTDGNFGPVETSPVPVEMFTPHGKKGAGILRHTGTAVTDASGSLSIGSTVTALVGPSPSDDPTLDILLLASITTPTFSRVSESLFSNATGGDIVIAHNGAPLLRGVVPELHAVSAALANGSLDPGSQSAFFGAFALDTLRLAGVDAGSPFFDAGMTGLQSAFILDVARLLDPRSPDYVAFGGLAFRFDAIEDLTRGGVGASSGGSGALRVEPVPEPAALAMFGVALLAVAAKVRKSTAGDTREVRS